MSLLIADQIGAKHRIRRKTERLSDGTADRILFFNPYILPVRECIMGEIAKEEFQQMKKDFDL